MLDAASRQRDFPTLGTMVYLNSAAEGLPPRVVGDALVEYFRDKQLGMDGRERHFAQWEDVKRLISEFYGMTPQEVSMCSCSSEAFNLAALALKLRADDEVVINDLDYPSGTSPWLQEGCSAKVRLWRSRDGTLHVEDLVALLGPRTRLVTTSLVSFFNGFMLPLPRVVDVVRRHSSALLAVDVTQALGRIPLKLEGVDLVVSSTHKWILASHGGGLVGVPSDRSDAWTAPAGGWFNLDDAFGQHRFERAVSRPGAASFTVGMPNFPAVYAVRAALDYIRRVGVEAIDQATRPLMRDCLDELRRLPVELLTPTNDESVAGIIAFRHSKAESIHARLRAKNIHIMHHAGRLRIAVHGYNTSSDIETLMRELWAELN